MDREHAVNIFLKNFYFFKNLLCMVQNETFNHNFFLIYFFQVETFSDGVL